MEKEEGWAPGPKQDKTRNKVPEVNESSEGILPIGTSGFMQNNMEIKLEKSEDSPKNLSFGVRSWRFPVSTGVGGGGGRGSEA